MKYQFFYNYYANGLVHCDEEEVICPRCKGVGYHKLYDICIYSLDEDDLECCYLCKGTGIVDWVTNAREAGTWEERDRKQLDAEQVLEEYEYFDKTKLFLGESIDDN